jgi:hypothetical protein
VVTFSRLPIALSLQIVFTQELLQAHASKASKNLKKLLNKTIGLLREI